MGVITTATLIVFGVTAVVGTAGAIWHAATEDERNAAKLEQLKAENEQLNVAIEYVNNVKGKLVSAKDYLADAKKDFKNGGHVSDDVPLANSEFTSCINNLTNAITNATNLISDFNATISQNNAEIKKLQ